VEPTTPTVDRTSVRTQVHRILRAQVASGELQPGEIYSAVTLSKRLGVSATPVREAMLDLASAGLVEAVRNRGFRILTVSPDDLDEIVTLRIWLEVPAMKPVIERATDDEIEALAPFAQNIVDAARRRDVSDFLLADHAFHTRLLQLARNDRLIRLVNELRDQTQLLGLHRMGRAGQLDKSADEHVELLDAVRGRDVGAAQRIMRRHLEHARGIWAGLDEAGAAAASEDAA
jgi:DNA-binding GntR family transcriptional regulator